MLRACSRCCAACSVTLWPEPLAPTPFSSPCLRGRPGGGDLVRTGAGWWGLAGEAARTGGSGRRRGLGGVSADGGDGLLAVPHGPSRQRSVWRQDGHEGGPNGAPATAVQPSR